MTPMLEKAAKAAEAAAEYQADEPAGDLAGPDPVANWPVVIRAALLAIREPDGPVIGTGWSSVDADSAEPQVSTMAVRDAWSAMIDAILGDEKP